MNKIQAEKIKALLEVRRLEVLELFPNHPLVVDFVNENGFIAGGLIRDLIRDKVPKDVDVYFKRELPLEIMNDLTANGWILSKNGNYYKDKVQFITLLKGNPRDVVKQFDFTINNNFYDFSSKELYFETEDKTLTINDNLFAPMSALVRLNRFLSEGFTISDNELVFLALKISSMKEVTDYREAVENFKTGSSSFKTAVYSALQRLGVKAPGDSP